MMLTASPWIIYGTTNVPNGSMLNPQPSVNRLIGEVGLLPYQVGNQVQLQLEEWGISGPDDGGTVGLYPIIGGATTAVQNRLPAAVVLGATGRILGNFILPASSILTFGLFNNNNAPSLVSWYALGTLNPYTAS